MNRRQALPEGPESCSAVTERDSRVRIAENVIWREIEGEAVLLDLDKGRYYGLDGIGLQMWSLLEEYGDRDTVVSRLVDEFEVSNDRCKEDLNHFLETLAEHGLVVLGQQQDENK